jgi:hypothetical protein
MPKILCPKHGKTFIVLVCPHIEDAVNEGKGINIVTIREELFDDDYWIYHYCQDCANKYGLKADAVYSGVNESITSLLCPICGECFQSWDQRPNRKDVIV